MNPQETQEMEKLKVQVRWLNEQLEGHEDNFGRQFDKIEYLKDLLSKARDEIEKLIASATVEQAKFSSLAAYLQQMEDSPLSRMLRPSNHKELKIVSALTAYKAHTYELFYEELKKLIHIGKDNDDLKLQLYDELSSMINKFDQEIEKHIKNISEQV